MKQLLDHVEAFHSKFDVPVAARPGSIHTDRASLRMRLHDEENRELRTAISHAAWCYHNPDVATVDDERKALVDVADGIIDLMYVLAGTALEFGLQDRLEEVWRRVHAANMAKDGGGKRADGKILKPPGWVPPDVEGALWPK